MEPAQLDPVLIYSSSGSLTLPSSTTVESLESEPYETRDRLLSQSPRKPANVFTVDFIACVTDGRISGCLLRGLASQQNAQILSDSFVA